MALVGVEMLCSARTRKSHFNSVNRESTLPHILERFPLRERALVESGMSQLHRMTLKKQVNV